MSNSIEPVVIHVQAKDSASPVINKTKDSVKGATSAVDRMIKSLEREKATVKMSTRERQLYDAELRGATQSQLAHIRSLQESIKQQHQAANASAQVTKNLRFMRGGFGQVGYQIQDIAVQLQMGQNAMLVFGQQGSQIASLFGPGGALIGAVLAVGAAIGTALLPQLFSTNEAVKELRDSSKGLIDRFDELTAAQKAYARQLAQMNISALKEEQAEYEQALADSVETLNLLQRAQAVGAIVSQNAIQKEIDAQVEYGAKIDGAKQAIVDQQTAVDDRTDVGEDLVKTLQEEYDGYMNTAKALAVKRAADRGESADVVKEIAALYDKINAYHAFIDAVKEEKKTRDEAAKNADARVKKDKAREERLTLFFGREFQRRAKLRDQAEKSVARTSSGYTNAMDTGQAASPELAALDSNHESRLARINAYYDAEKELLQLKGEETVEVELQQMMDKLALQEWYLNEKTRLEKEQIAASQSALMAVGNANRTAVATMVNQIGALFEQGSAAGKAFYVASQALAAANAIISAQQGAAAAIAAGGARALAVAPLDPTGALAASHIAAAQTQATLITAQGYMTAGIIAGQTVASFEGGGITFNGARSGGLDGKGGRMAMVHPNEKITDLEKSGGESAPINVSFSIVANDTRGFDELLMSRRGQIVSMINKAVMNKGRAAIA